MSTALQVIALACVYWFLAAFLTLVVPAVEFYSVGHYRRQALEYLVGSISGRLLDPEVVDAFLLAARRQELEKFVSDVIRGPLNTHPPTDKEKQQLVNLARKLREARRERSKPELVDRATIALLDDSDRVAALKMKRIQLQDALQHRMRERVARSPDHTEILAAWRGWLAHEERNLRVTAVKDVGLPAVKHMRTVAADRATRGALDGVAIGAMALLFVSFIEHGQDLISYLGTGSVLGAAVGLALTILQFVRAILNAEERRLRRAGLCVFFAGWYGLALTT